MAFYITEANGYDEHYRYYRATKHGVYSIKDCVMGGERVRILMVDSTQESATYLDADKIYLPLFRYIASFQEILESHPDPQKVLLIGGAGFAFPKVFFSTGQKGNLTVVEMDPRMIRLARRFFFLNELERDYGLKQTGRLRIIEDDGLKFLEETQETFDLIFNDAYIGNAFDAPLISERGIAAFHARLKPGGVLVHNLITPLDGPESIRGRIGIFQMNKYFSDVRLAPCDTSRPREMRQNCMLIGYREI
ncbi:MAG: fused MFS/spermidine synthase [Lachnospiraceae bacterium]|nr:fused MFS/spermidine synthase [Lachnospiraceae bacterium]